MEGRRDRGKISTGKEKEETGRMLFPLFFSSLTAYYFY